MATHHKLYPPSASERWLECTASPALLESLPRSSSWYAAEGTLGHTITEHVQRGGATYDALPPYPIGSTHEVSGHEITVTRELLDAAHQCVAWCEEIGPGVWLDEQRVRLPFTDGTADRIGTTHAEPHVLHVIDYKFGRGVVVDCENNTQLMLYAIGALITFAWLYENVSHVHLHIMQPRLYSHTDHRISVDSLQQFYTFATSRVDEAKAGGVFRPGKKACRWCDLAGTCKARAAYMAEQANAIARREAAVMTPAEMNDAYRWTLEAVDFIDAVQSNVRDRLRNNEAIPGLKLVRGRSSRHWADIDETLIAETITNIGGTQAYADPKLKTPAALEKEIGRALLKRIARDVPIVHVDGAPTVALAEDKRPAISDEFATRYSHIMKGQ